jgi:hypothetical protein
MLSTTEAEYVAAVLAGTEAIWMRQLFGELDEDSGGPTTLNMDNQSALSVAQNPKHHGRMKHLDLRYFWLRDRVASNKLNVQYVPTGDMIPDALTKALPHKTIERHRRSMGVQ